MAGPRRRNNSRSSGCFHISLSLPCLLVIALTISLVGLVFEFIAIHHMSTNDDHNRSLIRTNDAADTNPVIIGTQQLAQQAKNNKPVIAYTVTITGCSGNHHTITEATSLITQGAAVLKHSIHLAHTTSKYSYQMYAIIHPTATACSVAPLQQLGYKILIRNTPFDKSDIRQEFLRKAIDGASCCGAKEYLKYYAYTLVQHPIAVILDLDSLLLKPLDVMFDVMLLEGGGGGERNKELFDRLPIHKSGDDYDISSLYNKRIDGFYTKDYNLNSPGSEKYAGVQGGFLILRTDEDAFADYVNLVLEGNFIEGKGWGGKYGYFYGGAQVQGLSSYYYGQIHPEKGVELNRCRVNQMVDNPLFGSKSDFYDVRGVENKCRDGRDKCEDCRETDLDDIWSAHFTICGKPWNCEVQAPKLCSKLHSEWFRIRRSFEETRRDGNANEMRLLPKLEGSYRPEIFHGYCKGDGESAYLPLKVV